MDPSIEVPLKCPSYLYIGAGEDFKMVPKAQTAKIQKQMQDCISRLGVNLIVLWKPDKTKSVHGEIQGNVIFLYDSDERSMANLRA